MYSIYYFGGFVSGLYVENNSADIWHIQPERDNIGRIGHHQMDVQYLFREIFLYLFASDRQCGHELSVGNMDMQRTGVPPQFIFYLRQFGFSFRQYGWDNFHLSSDYMLQRIFQRATDFFAGVKNILRVKDIFCFFEKFNYF